MTCIICRVENSPSIEHVVPKALGGSFTIDRLCCDCNSVLGARADQGLIEHYASVARRVEHQLKGNNGKVPDPVGEAIRNPIETGIPGVRVRLTREAEGLKPRVQPFVEVNLEHLCDGTTTVTANVIVDEDEHNAEMYLRSALRKKGIRDEDVLRDLCSQILPHLELRTGPARIDIPMPRNEGGHQLGLAKIAYEMAHHWLGDVWLDDPIAHRMREAFLGDKNAGGQFRAGDGSMLPYPRVTADPSISFDDLALGYEPDRTHIMTLYPTSGKLFVCLWLFEAHTAMYRISDDASRYAMPLYDAVAMDTIRRVNAEFPTVMPSIS